MRIRRRQWHGEDFQMAPMIDMVFLLLVFFMCVSSLAMADKSRPVDLPESAESRVPEDLSDRVTITVAEDGLIYIGMDAAAPDSLKAALQARVRERPGVRLHVRADRGVAFGEIKKILRACAEAGAYEVIYATHQVD